MKHSTKPSEPGGGIQVYNSIFKSEVYSMLIDCLLACLWNQSFQTWFGNIARQQGTWQETQNPNREMTHLFEPSKSVSKDIFKRNCCRILTQSKQRPSRPYPLPDFYCRSFPSSPYVQQAKPWRRNYQVLHHTHCLPLKISFFREKEFHQSNQLASQLDSLWCQWSPGDIKDSQMFQHLRQMVQ